MQGVPATMSASDLVDLSGLMDDAKCFALVRQRRWPEGVRCPGCGSEAVIRHGRDDAQPDRQRYRCKACAGASTTSPERRWPAATSRCGSGCCALLHGPEPVQPADRLGD